MKLCIAAVGVVTLAVGSAATARELSNYSASYQTCIKEAGSDDDKRVACIKSETASQDKALNAAYIRLQKRLSVYQRNALANSERSWVKFRDSECNFQSSQVIGGPLGIIAQAQNDARAECMLRQTALRANALRESYSVSWDGTT